MGVGVEASGGGYRIGRVEKGNDDGCVIEERTAEQTDETHDTIRMVQMDGRQNGRLPLRP
jgi:hypothetical protein